MPTARCTHKSRVSREPPSEATESTLVPTGEGQTLQPMRTGNSNEDINERHDIIKLEEIKGKTFSDINLTNVFFGFSPKATEIKTKINKGGLIKLTSFGTAEETINKMKKTTYRMGQNISK